MIYFIGREKGYINSFGRPAGKRSRARIADCEFTGAHPNYRPRFCIPVVAVVGKNVTMSASPARPRRRTWVNVYRRGSFMVHHAPCKVALYILPLPVSFFSLSLCLSLSPSPCSRRIILPHGDDYRYYLSHGTPCTACRYTHLSMFERVLAHIEFGSRQILAIMRTRC